MSTNAKTKYNVLARLLYDQDEDYVVARQQFDALCAEHDALLDDRAALVAENGRLRTNLGYIVEYGCDRQIRGRALKSCIEAGKGGCPSCLAAAALAVDP